MKRVVDLAITTSGGDPERARQELEAWYDSAMDRVSGWYKRRTQLIVLALALGLTVVGNVNTIAIFQALQVDSKLRDTLVEEARRASPAGTTPEAMTAALTKAGLPVGWTGAGRADISRRWKETGSSIEIALGWLLTALAVSLGSPFWFDVLNRLMVIRSTVKPHEKSPEEQSEDSKGGDRNKASRAADGSGALPKSTAAAAQFTGAAGAGGAPTLVASDALADAHEDCCLCDDPAHPGEETADHDLPPATGGVAAQR